LLLDQVIFGAQQTLLASGKVILTTLRLVNSTRAFAILNALYTLLSCWMQAYLFVIDVRCEPHFVVVVQACAGASVHSCGWQAGSSAIGSASVRFNQSFHRQN